MRKNLSKADASVRGDVEEGRSGAEDGDEEEMQKYKRVPLPHWLVPIRTEIQRRPLTCILALAGILFIAILVIQYEQESPLGAVVTNQTDLSFQGWEDARSKPEDLPEIPLHKPKGSKKAVKTKKSKSQKHAKEEAHPLENTTQETSVEEDSAAEDGDFVVGTSDNGDGEIVLHSLTQPEFAYGGTWADREHKAHMTHSQPTPACHATTLVNLPGGEILAAWFGGRYESAEDVAIYVARRKKDNTWTEPIKAAKVHRGVPFNGKQKSNMPPKKGGEPHWNPVLFCEGSEDQPDVCDGEISLFFKVGWKIPLWETFVTRSTDGGNTWGAAEELVEGDKGGRGPVKNKPILLSNGNWLAPASLEGPAHWEGRRKPWRAFADRSEDKGRTWTASNLVFPESKEEGMIQPTLWESSEEPGHVFMLTRSMRGSRARVWRANSTDYGVTWNKPYKTTLPNNNSGLDVAKLPHSGTLVLIYNPVTSTRSPLRLAISTDNGETWPTYIDLEKEKGEVSKGREFSYPAIIPWPASYSEEGVSMTYTWNRKRVAFFQISLKELEARAEAAKAKM